MRLRAPVSLLIPAVLCAGFVAGCGGTDVSSDVIPKTTPELTVPSNDTSLATPQTSTTGTTTTPTATTTTPATGGATAAPTQTTPATGGAAPGGTTTTPTQPNTGGASPGGFSTFCRQNPGACPGQ